MQEKKDKILSVLSAVLIAATILFGTLFVSEQLSQSKLFKQSQMFRIIASQDQLDLFAIIKNEETRNVLTKFVAGLTNAYVSFEMIPYNEGQTFVKVIQSIPLGIHIEKFEYQRRNLLIDGIAQTPEAYQMFLESLKKTGHFHDVSGHSYLTVDDTVRFEIECASAQVYNQFLQNG